MWQIIKNLEPWTYKDSHSSIQVQKCKNWVQNNTIMLPAYVKYRWIFVKAVVLFYLPARSHRNS